MSEWRCSRCGVAAATVYITQHGFLCDPCLVELKLVKGE